MTSRGGAWIWVALVSACGGKVDEAPPSDTGARAGAGEVTGGAGSGGAESGGAGSGGAESGGAGSGGAESGGAESGGAESGGAESGGAESGGAESGGAESGGAESGGAESGGAESGGAESGGAESGGAESGGAESGGAESGGSAAGGAPAGGAATGGVTTGGLPNELLPCDFDYGPTTCPGVCEAIDVRRPNVLLLLDRSGSMADPPPDASWSKWEAVETALKGALADLEGSLNLGLLLLPSAPEGADPLCQVPEGADAITVAVGGGPETWEAFAAALQLNEPGGGTPMAAALERAREYFASGAGAELVGPRYVLLVTDGGPNCNDANVCDAEHCTVNLDGRCDYGNCCEYTTGAPRGEACLDDVAVLDRIEALRLLGVPTVVVGLPGTEVYAAYLDDFAVAGGLPTGGEPGYHAVPIGDDPAPVEAAFAAILSGLVPSCAIPLAEAPRADGLALAVAIDCELVPNDAASGWTYSPEPPTVTLHGELCARVTAFGAQRVDVVEGYVELR